MIIEKNIRPYIVYYESAISEALMRINNNKSRIIFALNSNGEIEGVFTDGDFRRYILNNKNIDLQKPVAEILNRDFISASIQEDPSIIISLFSEKIDIVPLIDDRNHLVALAFDKINQFAIGDFTISAENPAFIIAEIGNNHNGSLNIAKKLVDKAVEAKVDCVKFQMRDMETLYRNKGDDGVSDDLGTQYTLDLLRRFQLSNDDLFKIFDYCRNLNVLPLCTPWDVNSVQALEKYGIEAYKIASPDLTNHKLLHTIASTNKPVFCSTGMSKEPEIKQALELFHSYGTNVVFLHCNSTYPTPYKDINLSYLARLSELTGFCVGYSGHERGYHVPVSAIALGAKVIEKHLTLDTAMEGNDHKVSLLPDQFARMVQEIRNMEEALGKSEERQITQGEMMNRDNLAKSLVINCDLAEGDIIKESMIEIRSPGQGLQPNRLAELIGRKIQRKLNQGDFFFESDLQESIHLPREYKFRRPFGIPVRYHDYQNIITKSNFDFVEFHLSYNDLDEKMSDFVSLNTKLGFAVHAPELFSGDHILDLCTNDEKCRKLSIVEMQRVVDVTRELKKYFPRTKVPVVITNVGGASTKGFLPVQERKKMYQNLQECLSEIDSEGVEIIAQSMPPYPWHFGGQSYHNLFMDPDEIVDFCRKNDFRICLDISHSKLACNEFGWSFMEFITKVGPFNAHLHIVDAKGLDEEGLQIGEGNIDFAALAEHLERHSPESPFIPEIWQGHKNGCEGVWLALEKLEKWF